QSEILLKGCSSRTKLILEKGKQPVKKISKASAAYDLLIIGQPEKRNNFLDVLLRTDKDKFAENAACSVLRLTIK
ncbi:MAG: APA family basic amino acid/polyamine antiporter, partial [Saprospiraceae bacterium]